VPLDKSGLESDFEKIFNVEKSPEVQSESHCAQLVTDAIVKYLGDAKIAGPKAPGINPTGAAGGPLPDPAFAPTPMDPVTPPIANQSLMMGGWVGGMMGNASGDVKVWAAADAAMMGYVGATYTAFSMGGYMATGAAAPGPINLGSVMGDESEDSADIASKLADHIHTFFTACIFTGAYLMGPFVGPGPHVAPLE
jgi:hypothetical protein